LRFWYAFVSGVGGFTPIRKKRLWLWVSWSSELPLAPETRPRVAGDPEVGSAPRFGLEAKVQPKPSTALFTSTVPNAQPSAWFVAS